MEELQRRERCGKRRISTEVSLLIWGDRPIISGG